MTLNLLTWVPQGMVLCSDSMLTLQNPGPQGLVITNFEHAEKLIELGSSSRAAAMISGLGDLNGQLVSELLRAASRTLDAAMQPISEGVIQQVVVDAIQPHYHAHAAIIKSNCAAIWSAPETLTQINADRATRALPPLASVDPSRIIIRNDPATPANPSDFDFIIDLPLNVVAASYLAAPWAVAIEWPGPRIHATIPGSPLNWWGSGGNTVSRLVRGFDLNLLAANSADSAAQAALAYVMENALQYAMPTPLAAMPLQDAVNFTEYLGQVATGYDRFTSGSPAVGGPLDVMVLGPTERIWIRQKRIHSSLT